MPPRDISKEAIIDYLTGLLASLALDCGGELRIKRSAVRRITDETARQVLIEEIDSQNDEIVLRFGSKNTVIYPIGGTVQSESAKESKVPAQVSSNSSAQPKSYPPLTDEQISRAELRIRQIKTAREILRSKQPQA